ncbi:MAG TPA: hypothetical protein PKE26_05175 [Kiritimatiellia bacterium]|nr:hypothetical protein [Kiritimatiellia bacterium]HMO98484.1 hypothetical protein [Kiritimatiellia bacterium]HMP95792.1 hypothetical protein [Kiritimatiellia bacterium]
MAEQRADHENNEDPGQDVYNEKRGEAGQKINGRFGFSVFCFFIWVHAMKKMSGLEFSGQTRENFNRGTMGRKMEVRPPSFR